MMNAEEKEYMDYLIHNRTELTKQITRHLDRIELLQKKLDIATNALKEYADEDHWSDTSFNDNGYYDKAFYCENGFSEAQQSLKEMEGVK